MKFEKNIVGVEPRTIGSENVSRTDRAIALLIIVLFLVLTWRSLYRSPGQEFVLIIEIKDTVLTLTFCLYHLYIVNQLIE